MKIVSWNIRHGGGSGARRDGIVSTILAFQSDILILPEFRVGPSGSRLVSDLHAAGYSASHPPAEAGQNTVMVASRLPIHEQPAVDANLPDHRHIWHAGSGGISLAAVYFPCGKLKLPYWKALVGAASLPEPPDLMIGDFNTGTNTLDKAQEGERFVGPEYMDHMQQVGYIDLWRSRHPQLREYTWFSPQRANGFRVDHAFARPAFNRRVTDCRYDHVPRQSKLSDHSALILDVEP